MSKRDQYMSEGSRLTSSERDKDGTLTQRWESGHVLSTDKVLKDAEAVTVRGGPAPPPLKSFDKQ